MKQGIVNSAGTETFEKEPAFAKFLQKLKPTLLLDFTKSPLVFLICL